MKYSSSTLRDPKVCSKFGLYNRVASHDGGIFTIVDYMLWVGKYASGMRGGLSKYGITGYSLHMCVTVLTVRSHNYDHT